MLCIACVESFTGQFDFVFCVLIRGLRAMSFDPHIRHTSGFYSQHKIGPIGLQGRNRALLGSHREALQRRAAA